MVDLAASPAFLRPPALPAPAEPGRLLPVPGERPGRDPARLGGDAGVTVPGAMAAAALLALPVLAAVPAVPAAATAGAPPAAAVGGAPHATGAAAGPVTTAAARAPRCRPGDLSASAALTVEGTTLAGAVVFTATGGRACVLRGVPAVTVAATGTGSLDVVERRAAPGGAAAVVLAPGGHGAHGHGARGAGAHGAGAGAKAGVSVTWTTWRCAPGSFSLDVRFPGWPRPLVVPYGAVAGDDGPACTTSRAETLYVGPVTRVGR